MVADVAVANFVAWGMLILFAFLASVAAQNEERGIRIVIVIVGGVTLSVAVLMLATFAQRVGDWRGTVIMAELAIAALAVIVWGVVILRGAPETPQATPPAGTNYVPPRPFKPTWGRPRFATPSRVRYESRYAGYRRAGGKGAK